MSDFGKINIYVSDEVAQRLDEDAKLFEVFKNDGVTINRNKFLNLLVLGYSESFANESEHMRIALGEEIDKIPARLSPVVKSQLIDGIMSNAIHPSDHKRKGIHQSRLSLKPVKYTEGIIGAIHEVFGPSDSDSSYFRSMLSSYCQKPSNEREQIIFSRSFEPLKKACRPRVKSRPIVSFSTTRDPEKMFSAIPYDVAIGQGEQFNYLLCSVLGRDGQKPMSFRLARITRLARTGRSATIDPEVEELLNRTKRFGAQYVISSDVETVVRLTVKGVQAYQSIYFGRPEYTKREQLSDGEWLYRFKCSQNQLFLFFKRFGPDEAEVVSPSELREQIIEFHQGALAMYKKE